MDIGTEQQMSYFVRDCETGKRRHVRFRLIGEPAHAVHIDGGELSGPCCRIDE
jgi:hypothetical protein